MIFDFLIQIAHDDSSTDNFRNFSSRTPRLFKYRSPKVLFLAENTPKPVWQPGSDRTRWGSLSAPPGPRAALRGPLGMG